MDENTIDSILTGNETEAASVLMNLVEENVTDSVARSHIQGAIARMLELIGELT